MTCEITRTRAHEAACLAKARGYTVDELGHVLNPQGKRLATPRDNAGYPYFSVRHHDRDEHGRLRASRLHVHKFIAYFVWGDKAFAEGIEVRHLNDDGADNRQSNLALGSSSDNKMDRPHAVRLRIARTASRAVKGKPGARRKLSPAEVRRARKMLETTFQWAVADELGVSQSAISQLKRGRTYKYVKEAA